VSEQIRNITNTKIALTKEEYNYYETLSKVFGQEAFVGLFQTNASGYISNISPNLDKVTPIPIIFFLLNVSFNQRMRKLDGFITRVEGMEKKIKILEEKNNILEKTGAV